MKNTSVIIQWILCVLFGIGAILNGFKLSSVLIALSALLIVPIPCIRNFYKEKFKINTRLVIILAVLLFITGMNLSSVTDSRNESTYFRNGFSNSEIHKTEPYEEKISEPKNPPAHKQSTPVFSGKTTAVNPTEIPAYSGNPYLIINNNQPDFSAEELSKKGYEHYSELDSLGRCGIALASCCKEIMPNASESRKSISSLKPSGWVQAKYDGISGGYLWNRCHLIGWQLSAENANRKNLITGTHYLNKEGMLTFENMVVNYIKETDNHVIYRVTPIFEGSNLVCSGVQMEAYSIEDNGEGICFNVYCYNVQPGINIDYSNGNSTDSKKTVSKPKPYKQTEPEQPSRAASVATAEPQHDPSLKNSGTVWIPSSGSRYHSNPNCSNMKNPTQISKSKAIAYGYKPCKKCC